MTPALQHLLGGVDQDLECGQALLSVHHDASRKGARGIGVLLQDDRAHEVGFAVVVVQDRLRQILDIIPQRFPLPVALPDIAALEGRDLVAARAGQTFPEDGEDWFRRSWVRSCRRT